jgi:hypothetical protein
MQNKYAFEVVHRLMVDLKSTSNDTLFGGVPVILGGDFAQILPVVPGGSRTETVLACLQRSWLWPKLRRLHLQTNMRVRSDPENQTFVQWISQLPYDPALNGLISLPSFIAQSHSVQDLISSVYPSALMAQAASDYNFFRGRAILSTLNATVTELNRTILEGFCDGAP